MRDVERAVFCRYAGPALPRWRCFDELVDIVEARRPEDVVARLEDVERAVAGGLCAAGLMSYEAAPGFDPALVTHCADSMPLLWFALFRRTWEQDTPPREAPGECEVGPWRPTIRPAEYDDAIGRIKHNIARGDTYQVNETYRLRATFRGEPWALFRRLCEAQRAEFGAYLDLGDQVVCSASPELLLDLRGDALVTRPMKGTAPRGRTSSEDRRLRAMLTQSAKDRAENAMIVDMMRNDLGRIAEKGSVQVDAAFDVEKFPTVYQMTSTVSARSTASLTEIFRATFPAASITGAPKVRTMQIIRELERDPRGVYTGCIGWLAPERRAVFSVAIRTVTIDRRAGIAQYGTGGGITWDSQSAGEFAESQTKAALLTTEAPRFELLETMLYQGAEGYSLLDGHLRRLADSAEYFDFAIDLTAVRRQLAALASRLGDQPQCVRLRIGRQGQIAIEASPAPTVRADAWRLRLAHAPVDPQNVFLYHKTTWREVYERAGAARGDCDDVVLWNAEGQATETTIANLVVEKDERLVTPPIACGLLPGVLRQHLLETAQIHEDTVSLDDLRRARRLFAVNSVRGWMPAVLVGGETA
ncbi:MAG: aminodeoxychorismate synthase component I [Thermoguttaceae bacterium]